MFSGDNTSSDGNHLSPHTAYIETLSPVAYNTQPINCTALTTEMQQDKAKVVLCSIDFTPHLLLYQHKKLDSLNRRLHHQAKPLLSLLELRRAFSSHSRALTQSRNALNSETLQTLLQFGVLVPSAETFLSFPSFIRLVNDSKSL
eukprot:GHVS01071655.1.p3 GENE.GHVS01071655.1~~GHVS01071655.1.p3  ORF type:complete len:145 (+),score=22.62 GHVS01071655.1:778-1212(+)